MERFRRSGALTGCVLVLAGWAPGCSFAFGDGPPREHAQMPYFDCVSTPGLAVADGVIAIGGVTGAVTTFRKSKQEYADQNGGASRNAAGGLQIVTAAGFAASAIYGLVQSSRCTQAKAELEARILRSAAPVPGARQPPPTFPSTWGTPSERPPLRPPPAPSPAVAPPSGQPSPTTGPPPMAPPPVAVPAAPPAPAPLPPPGAPGEQSEAPR